jgi:hypothetical protein
LSSGTAGLGPDADLLEGKLCVSSNLDTSQRASARVYPIDSWDWHRTWLGTRSLRNRSYRTWFFLLTTILDNRFMAIGFMSISLVLGIAADPAWSVRR